MSQIQGNLVSAGSIQSSDEPIASPDAPGSAPSALAPMWRLIKRLPAYARLSTALARDPRVPPAAKAMLVAGGAYLVSPIDFVPGFIPVAGQLDDLYVILMGLRGAMRLSPTEVIEEHFTRVGLPTSIVNEDLAAIRTFVRRGMRWSFDNGSQALARISRRATGLARRACQVRQEGQSSHDQKPL